MGGTELLAPFDLRESRPRLPSPQHDEVLGAVVDRHKEGRIRRAEREARDGMLQRVLPEHALCLQRVNIPDTNMGLM